MAKDDYGNCPKCKANLTGGFIWEHFYNEFITIGYWRDKDGNYTDRRRILSIEEAEIAADEVAANYGATRTSGRWGLAIALVDNDRVYAHKCPQCNFEWIN